MKNTQNKKGFTLVELIIVITILAVLATIAFVSFQGYAADSRDTKVTSELGQLRNSIEAKAADGVSLLAMVSNTGSNLTGITIGGTGSDASTTYKAGGINMTVLGADESKFGKYRAGVSTKNGGVYQLAGKLEKSNSALVLGNYVKRTNAAIPAWVVSGQNLTITNTNTGAGFFKIGDVTTAGKVTWISKDLLTITFDGTMNTTPALSATESEGLIASSTNSGTAVTQGSTVALPY
jgi:prepilin-type N-terminal cleavage/methylation domain-containing protein